MRRQSIGWVVPRSADRFRSKVRLPIATPAMSASENRITTAAASAVIKPLLK